MRIGIDGYVLSVQNGGDATYVRNLVRALAAVDGNDAYTVFAPQPLAETLLPSTEHLRHVEVRPSNLRMYLPISLPLALARARPDVLHVQYMAPLHYPVRMVVTVHDISYEHYPQFFPPGLLTQLRFLVPLTIRRAAAVLTVSEFSRQDLIQRYHVPPQKVVVAPNAADPSFRPVRDEARLAAVRTRYGVGEHFILCVGNLQPRKNLRTLIAAYVQLREAGAIGHKLVLVGRQGWLCAETFAVACASGYADELIFTGFVPDGDLVALYNAADLFVYPSLFEGFGLPPLEAMACGTPVVTSNTSALPEVVGDAALTVDPLDVEALAGAIARALGDADLRERLVAKGLQRAASFSWEETARTVLRVYHEAART